MKVKYTVVFILFWVTGCVPVKINSFVDSDFRSKTYKKMAIFVEMEYLDLRSEAENNFVKRFNEKTDTECQSSLQVIQPTREYTDDEFSKIFKNNGFDGVLSIIQTDYYENQKYIPESQTTTTTGDVSANTFYYGNTATTYGRLNSTTQTTKSGGYFVSMPRMRHEIRLIDVETGKTAWLGATFSEGDEGTDLNDIFKSLSKKTVKTLIKEGLVIEKDD